MSFCALPAPTVAEIQTAPSSESHEAIATRLGVSVGAVRKYRRKLRVQQEEATAAVIAEHARRHVTDALTDLTDLRAMARETYEQTRDHRDGGLWISAIRTELVQASGVKSPEFDGMTDDDLKHLIRDALGV